MSPKTIWPAIRERGWQAPGPSGTRFLKYDVPLAVGSAFLLNLSFPNFLILSFPELDLSFLAWVALVPLLLGLQHQRPFPAFGVAFVTGFGFVMGEFYWINVPSGVQVIDFLLPVTYLGVYFGLFGLALRFLTLRTTMPAVVTAPTLWVSLEYVRSHFFFLELPWGLLGHSQYQNLPLIQLSSLTGVYGVSFLIVMGNVAVFELISRRSAALRPAVVTALLVGATLAHGWGGAEYASSRRANSAHRHSRKYSTGLPME